MKTIGIAANCAKPRAGEVLARLAAAAARHGLTLVVPEGDPVARHLPGARALPAAVLPASVDGLMALGGDGTLLAAVRALHNADVPIVGVNLGSLGFLTTVVETHLEEAVQALAEDSYTLSTRTMACCERLREGQPTAQYTALNDIVLGWGHSARVGHLGLAVNNEEVTAYMCDGLIVATPTGSTGHSLSAGGPILHPETEAFLLNVICPHALSARPMVIPDRRTVDVALVEVPEGKNLLLSVDGQQIETLHPGDRLTVRRHPSGVRFVHPPGYQYFHVLRQKLHWRGSSI